MQITDVEAIPVTVDLLPLEEGGIAPYVTNHGELRSIDRILVRVETDDDITGWGEMREFLSPAATTAVIEEGVAPLMLGRSPFEVESFRRLLFIEYTNIDMFVAPIEVACWDIIGQALEKPIYEMLGGWTAPDSTKRRTDPGQTFEPSVEVAYCLGILPPDESATYARRARDDGYNILKTKAGRDWREDVERILAMHEAVDDELSFRLDPNQGWRFDEALRVCQALADHGVYLQYVEQPIRVDAHESLEALSRRVAQPIAANEDTYVPHNLRELVARGAIDVAVIDLTPAGGITGLRELAHIAEDANLTLTHHCAFDLGIRTAAILHAVTGIPGFNLPPDAAYEAWADDVVVDPLTVEDGRIQLPEGPGLGVRVDGEKVERYRTD